MNILVTNDDGIFSEGLAILVEWAKQLGKVTVCAPKFEQSAKSHAIDIHNPFEVKRDGRFGKEVDAYCIDSTPADCVRVAVCGLEKKFDMVFSGINCGINVGDDIIYSATCGALFEAGFLGINGIAFSTFFNTFDGAKANIDATYRFITENKLFDYNGIYNVNFPVLKAKGIRITKQSGHYFQDRYIDKKDGTFFADGYCVHDNKHDEEIDADACTDGFVSVTPLTVKRTAYAAFEKLRKLNN